MPNPFNIINPANPFNVNNPRLQQMRSMYQAFQDSKNPMALMQQLASRNPQLQPIVQMMQQGANPNQVFNNICRQRGINPQDFIKAIKG